jgi:hypothetical protein
MSDMIQRKAEKLSTYDATQDWHYLLAGLVETQKRMRRNCLPHELVHSYFGTRVKDGDAPEPATDELDQTPFRQSLRVFKTLYKINYPFADSCKVLVSMVGFSLEPVMHTLLTLLPDKVILVFSQESAKFDGGVTAADYIKFLITLYCPSYTPVLEEIRLASTDTAEVFARVHEKINEYSFHCTHGNVAIDVTGGKKSMDASAFLAASLFDNVAIYYVDYEEYDIHGGYPVWGSEFLNLLDNPYSIYNVREEQLVKELWEKGNYSAVKKLADSLIKSLTLEKAKKYLLGDKRILFVEIAKAAACYEAWLRFDYEEAGNSMFNVGATHHGQVLAALAQCSNVFVKGQICGQGLACLTYKLATDRYLRGREATHNGESNRAALCYTQAVEVLLKFAYSAERFEELERSRTEVLLNNLFNGHEKKSHKSIFRGERLRKRIKEDVLDQRNDLSHHSCRTQPFNVREIFSRMESAVYEFLNLFAATYRISSVEIETFSKQATFLHLDDNLQFTVPNLAEGERTTKA